MEKQYTYAEAAVALRVAESTLRRWVSKGHVPCHRAGRLVRFTEADLTAALKPSPTAPAETPVRRRGRRSAGNAAAARMAQAVPPSPPAGGTACCYRPGRWDSAPAGCEANGPTSRPTSPETASLTFG